MPRSFFTTTDSEWFQPTEHARGPWDPDACHAGPPTGLIARAVEAAVPDKQLVRLSVDLNKPVPYAGFWVTAAVVREGRVVTRSRAELVDGDGATCVSAAGLHIASVADRDFPTYEPPHPAGPFAAAEIGDFPLSGPLHGLPNFTGPGIEIAYPPGETWQPGPTTVWMRTVPLLEDETPSPFQRICPLADCGNAIGRNAEPNEVNFVNADLTIALHRHPEGEWLGSQATSHWHPNGIGQSDALLFDDFGVVGRAIQTLIIR